MIPQFLVMRKSLERILEKKYHFNYDGIDENKVMYSNFDMFEDMVFVDYESENSLITLTCVNDNGDVVSENIYSTIEDVSNKLNQLRNQLVK